MNAKTKKAKSTEILDAMRAAHAKEMSDDAQRWELAKKTVRETGRLLVYYCGMVSALYGPCDCEATISLQSLDGKTWEEIEIIYPWDESSRPTLLGLGSSKWIWLPPKLPKAYLVGFDNPPPYWEKPSWWDEPK